MRFHSWTRVSVVSLVMALVACGTFAASAAARTDIRIAFGGVPRGAWQRQPVPPVYLQPPIRPRRPIERRGAYQEPASARGYSDGYKRGLDDGRDRDRYDPVGARDYRDGDPGYYRTYGSRDAYKNNYRAGFRQGYEEGYRDGARGRR